MSVAKNRFGDRITTEVTYQHWKATIYSTAETINTILVEKRYYDPVKSYWGRTGDMSPAFVEKLYLKMKEITSQRVDHAADDAWNRD